MRNVSDWTGFASQLVLHWTSKGVWFYNVIRNSVAHAPVALNKLEKVALRYSRQRGRPPVLIINNVHYFKNDDDGRDMLLQLQQRAEAWAASGWLRFDCPKRLDAEYPTGIMTMIFST